MSDKPKPLRKAEWEYYKLGVRPETFYSAQFGAVFATLDALFEYRKLTRNQRGPVDADTIAAELGIE